MSPKTAHQERSASLPMSLAASADEDVDDSSHLEGSRVPHTNACEHFPSSSNFQNDSSALHEHALPKKSSRPVNRAIEPSIAPLEREYLADPPGGELADNARVWNIYRAEATTHDDAMLDDLNKTLDILLVFAGIFSATVTTFLVDSYKSLEPDYTEYVAGAIYSLSLQNRSADLLSRASALSLDAPSQFTPSTSARVLNAVWFTSLVLALISAFISILAKRWLEEYRCRTSAPARSLRQWAHRRALYFDGFERWRVQDMVAALPLCLHIAMFLFVSGLVLLLWDLDRLSSLWLLALTGLAALFYSASTISPFFSRDTPLGTPVSHAIRQLSLFVHRTLPSVARSFMPRSGIITVSQEHLRSAAAALRRIARGNSSSETLDLETQHYDRGHKASVIPAFSADKSFSVRQLSTRILGLATAWRGCRRRFKAEQGTNALMTPPTYNDRHDTLDARALQWMIITNVSADSVCIAYQAIAAFPPWSPALEDLRRGEYSILIIGALKARYEACRMPGHNWNVPRYNVSPQDVGRDIRSAICLYGPRGMAILLADCAPALFRSVEQSKDYDVPFIIDAAYSRTDEAAAARFAVAVDTKNYQASTALLVLQFPISVCCRLNILDYLIETGVSDEDLLHAAQSGRNGALCRWKSHHVLAQCTLHCSLELISSDAIQDPTPCTGTHARSVISNIIRRMDRTHVMPLYDSAFLQLVVTQVNDNWTADDLEQAMIFMATLVHTLKVARHGQPPPLGWRKLWGTAIAAALTAATHRDSVDGRDIASRAVNLVLEIFSLEAEMTPTPHNDPDFAVQLLSPPLFGKRSSWEILNRLLSTSVGDLFDVADAIVSSLYAKGPTTRDSDLACHFTSTSLAFLQRLLCAWSTSNTRDNEQSARFLRFARLYNEIKSSWLQDAVGYKGDAERKLLEEAAARLTQRLRNDADRNATISEHARISYTHTLFRPLITSVHRT